MPPISRLSCAAARRILPFRAPLFLLAALCSGPVLAAPGEVLSNLEINDATGGFGGVLQNADFFGSAVASLGDLDGDGVPDLAVGVPGADDGGTGRGCVWVLFLEADGSVKAQQKISATDGGFGGLLDNQDQFGQSLAPVGDLDGDGVVDLAVGAHLDDDGGAERGAVWILFLNTDGSVKAQQKISSTQGGFTGALDDSDAFGISLAKLDDVDGDGVTDLAVGAHQDDDGGPGRGAVWVIFLNSNGTVKAQQKISDTQGGFAGLLDDGDLFGISVAGLADRNGDGVAELVVGADQDDDGGAERGAVWVLFLESDGSVFHEQKISATSGGFQGLLTDGDLFGRAVSGASDLDGDGFDDLIVGANQDDDGGSARGAVWVVFLNSDGSVAGEQKVSSLAGGFAGALGNGDRFGSALASAGDVDGDGVEDLAVGAIFAPGGGMLRGSTWMLLLSGAVCGDGVAEFSEACDDGGNIPEDGCSAICQVETIWLLVGIAEGGHAIYFSVDSVALELMTTAGQTASEVAQAIADTINADPTLQMNGTVASATGGQVITNGVLSDTGVDDPGLGIRAVPSLSQWSIMGLAATLLLYGLVCLPIRPKANAQ